MKNHFAFRSIDVISSVYSKCEACVSVAMISLHLISFENRQSFRKLNSSTGWGKKRLWVMQSNQTPKTMHSIACDFCLAIPIRIFVFCAVFCLPTFSEQSFPKLMIIPIIQYLIISSRWFFPSYWRQHALKMFQVFLDEPHKRFPIYSCIGPICKNPPRK